MNLTTHRRKLICVGLFLVTLAASSLTSCALSSLQGHKNDEKNLVLAIEDFSSALRWGDYKKASLWIVPQLQEQFWKQTDELQDAIRLAEYEIRNVTMMHDGNSADVVLRYRYYYTKDPQLQTATLSQRWQYHEEAKTWQIVRTDLGELMRARF